MTDDSDSDGGLLGVVQSVTPNFLRESFTLKFALVLIVLGLAVGAVGFVSAEQLKGEFQEEVDEKLASLAEQNAKELADWDQANLNKVEIYARSPTLIDGQDTAISDYVINEGGYLITSEKTPFLHYVNATTGNITKSSTSLYTNINVTNVEDINSKLMGGIEKVRPNVSEFTQTSFRIGAFEGALNNDPLRVAYISTIPSNTDHVLIYTVPVTTFTGNLQGQAAATEGSSSGPSGVTMVTTNEDGEEKILMEQYGNEEMLFRAYDESNGIPERARTSTAPGTEIKGPANGALAANETYDLADQRYAVGYAKVPGSEWVVMIHSNTEEAYGEVEAVANQSLIATGIGILLIGLFGAVLGRNTSKSIDRLTSKAEEMEDGNLDVDLSTSRIDNIGRLYDGFDNMRSALKEQINEAQTARKEAEVSRAEAMEMNTYLQDKADEYAEIMQQCANGDLTQRMETDDENEAMDRISIEFNNMIDELEKTTGQLKSFADEVETAGESVQTSSESVRDASEQVADSIQKISDDAYDQKDRLDEVSAQMDQIADDLDTYAEEHDVDFGDSLERIEGVATSLSSIVELSEETMASAENVAGAAEEQAAEINEVSQRAEDLTRYAGPLKEVLSRFETESEHEFYFPTGPGSESPAPGDDADK